MSRDEIIAMAKEAGGYESPQYPENLVMDDAASAAQSEREKFEAWLSSYWPRETYRDDEGDELYCVSWVQGAWMGWQGRSAQPTPPAVVEPLTDEQIEALPLWKRFVGLWPETRREIVRTIERHHGIGIKKGEGNGN